LPQQNTSVTYQRAVQLGFGLAFQAAERQLDEQRGSGAD
jgi:hypothetical protein